MDDMHTRIYMTLRGPLTDETIQSTFGENQTLGSTEVNEQTMTTTLSYPDALLDNTTNSYNIDVGYQGANERSASNLFSLQV
jgi:hypothetical protein